MTDRLRNTLRLHKKVISEDLDSQSQEDRETELFIPSSPEWSAATEVLLEDQKSLAAIIAEWFTSCPELETVPHLSGCLF